MRTILTATLVSLLLCSLSSVADLPPLTDGDLLTEPSRDEFIKPAGYSEERNRAESDRVDQAEMSKMAEKTSAVVKKFGPPKRKPASIGAPVKAKMKAKKPAKEKKM